MNFSCVKCSGDRKENDKRREEYTIYWGNILQIIKPDGGNECYAVYRDHKIDMRWRFSSLLNGFNWSNLKQENSASL